MTSGAKSMALATALALMTIGMGSAVNAAERQHTRGCTSPNDCGGGGFRLNDRRLGGDGDGPRKAYQLRTQSDTSAGNAKKTLRADRTGREPARKRRLITNENNNDTFGKNSNDLVRKPKLRTRDTDQPRQDVQARKKHKIKSAWKFDKNHHQRRKHRNKWYRYYHGGFYYPERYWLFDHDPYYSFDPSRVSCGEGRDIVRESGFSRVSTVECVGLTYTYLGRRSGETYRIVINARTGDIVSRKRA